MPMLNWYMSINRKSLLYNRTDIMKGMRCIFCPGPRLFFLLIIVYNNDYQEATFSSIGPGITHSTHNFVQYTNNDIMREILHFLSSVFGEDT